MRAARKSMNRGSTAVNAPTGRADSADATSPSMAQTDLSCAGGAPRRAEAESRRPSWGGTVRRSRPAGAIYGHGEKKDEQGGSQHTRRHPFTTSREIRSSPPFARGLLHERDEEDRPDSAVPLTREARVRGRSRAIGPACRRLESRVLRALEWGWAAWRAEIVEWAELRGFGPTR
jgi:hypothetical protein